jgi:hypothetical protein
MKGDYQFRAKRGITARTAQKAFGNHQRRCASADSSLRSELN